MEGVSTHKDHIRLPINSDQVNQTYFSFESRLKSNAMYEGAEVEMDINVPVEDVPVEDIPVWT